MKVFISWSGRRSQQVATALSDWLPYVVPSAECWMSRRNIDAGARWGNELARELADTRFGILCLTVDNGDSPWLIFEAGSLAKTIDDTFVCPYLLDLNMTEIPADPLRQFQGKQADKGGTWELVLALNKAAKDSGLPEDRLRTAFQKWWPDLRAKLLKVDVAIPRKAVAAGGGSVNDLAIDDAIQTCERYATLVARYIVVEFLLANRASNKNWPDVFSWTRKRIYGFERVLGNSTIYSGKFILANVIGAAINNATWIVNLQEVFSPLLLAPTSDLLAPVKLEKPAPGEYDLSSEDGWDRMIRDISERQRPLEESGLHQLTRMLTNTVWKRCEFAIKNPEKVLQEATLPP